MKQGEHADERSKVLGSLTALPKKILAMHGHENLTEFVLHDLASEGCLNFQRAAYFVDNPDFNCVKGVVGLNRQEMTDAPADIWQDSTQFSECMRQAPFNQLVRKVYRPSLYLAGGSDESIAQKLAADIQMPHYHYCSWNTKHNNHGVLVYEPVKDDVCKNAVQDGACLLGLCPVF